MARLDAFIELLVRESADELVLETGAGATLHRHGAPARALLKQRLTAAQIAGAVGEVLPLGDRPRVPAHGTAFTYASPAGAMHVRCESGPSGLRVVVTPQLAEAELAHDDDSEDENALAELVAHSEDVEHDQLFGEISDFSAGSPLDEDALLATPPRGTPISVPRLVEPARAARSLEEMVALAAARAASDVHLSTGAAPVLRVDGRLQPFAEAGTPPVEELVWAALPASARAEFERTRAVTCVVQKGAVRYRASVFAEARGLAAVLRPLPAHPREAETLGLPRAVFEHCLAPHGLIVVTSQASAGGSTTLAALVDYINRNRDETLLTLEEPIEIVHASKRSLVRQREVPLHVATFALGLRQALDGDADIVVAGELRDAESARLALELAERGRLVLAALHVPAAVGAVERLIELAPQSRGVLADTLRCVIAQTLCSRIGGGRAPAFEVLVNTPAVAQAIREGKTAQVPALLQAGRAQGLVPQGDALLDLVQKKIVDPREALRRSHAKVDLKALLDRAGASAPLA